MHGLGPRGVFQGTARCIPGERPAERKMSEGARGQSAELPEVGAEIHVAGSQVHPGTLRRSQLAFVGRHDLE